MRQLIHISDHRGRLCCDNPDCGHVLPEGAVTWGEHLIGYPCPKCSSDMLTRRDFRASERVHRMIAWINYWFGWLGREYDPNDPEWGQSVSIRHHDGKVIIKEEDHNERT